MGDDSTPEVRPPEQIAETTRARGAKKAALDPQVVVVLGTLAGAYIAFGSLFSTVVAAGADGLPYGFGQLLAGAAFSLGLILVLVGGAELFTGNTLLVVAWAEERAGARKVLQALGIAFVANLVGSLAVVALAFAAGVHTAGEGAVGVAALQTAATKAGKGFGEVVASGILANMLVCLAVWLAFGARSAADKVLVIVPPIAAFVAMGLEHSVANMSLVPMGLVILELAGPQFWADAGRAPADFAALTPAGFARNLIGATLGNAIGGALVGLAYWSAYLRPDPEAGP